MPARSTQTGLPLPRGWRKITRAGVLHAISVAAMAMTPFAWAVGVVHCTPRVSPSKPRPSFPTTSVTPPGNASCSRLLLAGIDGDGVVSTYSAMP